MRDPELMLDLLRRMERDTAGRIEVMPCVLRMIDLDKQLRHHVELLVDAGHARWEPPSYDQVARITNEGYDFLGAVEQNETLKDVFIDRFKRGMPYVSNAVDIVAQAAKLVQV